MGLHEAFLLLGGVITGVVFTAGLWDYRRRFYCWAVGLQVFLLMGCGITGGVFTAWLWDYRRWFYCWALGLQEEFYC